MLKGYIQGQKLTVICAKFWLLRMVIGYRWLLVTYFTYFTLLLVRRINFALLLVALICFHIMFTVKWMGTISDLGLFCQMPICYWLACFYFYSCCCVSWWAMRLLIVDTRAVHTQILWYAVRVRPTAIWCLSNNRFKGKNIQGSGCVFVVLGVFPSRFFVCPHSLLALESDRNGENLFIRYAFHHIYVRDICIYLFNDCFPNTIICLEL